MTGVPVLSEITSAAMLGDAFLSALAGGLWLCLKLALITVPLVTVFEILRHEPVFGRWGARFDPMMRSVGLTRDAVVPLFTGIFLGLAYGAGIIIQVARERKLPAREVFLLGLFLATCHSVVEDILVFVAIGGSGTVMLGVRVALAFALTALTARLLPEHPSTPEQGEPPAPVPHPIK